MLMVGWISSSRTTRKEIFYSRIVGVELRGSRSGVLRGLTEDGIPVPAGRDFRDWNNDGKPSLFVTALGRETFPLFRNEGTGLFSVDTYKQGIGFPSLKMSGWGNGIYDFDNDGFKDLFTANSHVMRTPLTTLSNTTARRTPCPESPGWDIPRCKHASRAGYASSCAIVVCVRRSHNDGKIDVVVPPL